ncbi:hypothetical protein ES708_23501 [subsurface metagenome]
MTSQIKEKMTTDELKRYCNYPHCYICSVFGQCVDNWALTKEVPHKILTRSEYQGRMQK